MELERCRRHVRAVDGDGNSSQWVEAQRVPGEAETYYGFAGYRSQQGGSGGIPIIQYTVKHCHGNSHTSHDSEY